MKKKKKKMSAFGAGETLHSPEWFNNATTVKSYQFHHVLSG